MNSFACRWFLAVLLATGLGQRAFSEEEDPIGDALDGLSGATMLEMVKELADDKMLGRKTGWQGGPKIEEWVAAQFANFGLHPADRAGAYLEPYRFASTNVKAPIGCTVAGAKLAYGEDYSHLSYSGSAKVEAPVVFCGYGIDRPELGHDDYKGVDVKGKIVIAIRGVPDTADSGLGVERFIGYKSSAAADKGAVGFILVENEKPLTGTIQAQYYRPKVPGIWLSQAAVDKLLAPTGKKIADLKKAYDEGKGGGSFETGSKAAIEVNSDFKKDALGNNVLARIDGRDPDLKKEIVLVGAHCDHLGVDPMGRVFNGADDNASGTAVLMHLADILSLNKYRPKRTIVFCAFTGEEQGLHGSMEIATNSPFQGGIVAVLNMDMVGQGDPVVSCAGVGSYPLIGKRLQDAIPAAMKKSVHFSPRAGGGGDHWPFYERGIPAFAISTRGKHPNYHTPLDDSENIKAENLEITAKAVGRWLVALGSEEKPLYDPHAMARFLVNDTLRPVTVRPFAKDVVDAAGRILMLGIPPIAEDFDAQMKSLRELASDTLLMIRTADDVRKARATSKRIMALWFGGQGAMLEKHPERIPALKEAGFRIVGVGDQTVAPSDRVLRACRKAGLVADLSALPGSCVAEVAGRLGGHPAIRLHLAGHLPKPVEGVLLLDSPAGRNELSSASVRRPDVVVLGSSDRGPDALVDALVKSGLDLSPGSEDRKRARAWLGETLLRLLEK